MRLLHGLSSKGTVFGNEATKRRIKAKFDIPSYTTINGEPPCEVRGEDIDAAISNGNIDRMNMLLSAAHLLNCEANNLVEEASDLIAKNGLLLGDLKKLHNNFVKSADLYFLEFSSLVETEKSKMDIFRDMDDFDAKFREWAKLPSDWKPKEVKQ